MSSKNRLLLLSSAASMIVVSAPSNVAQAADIPVIKANPVEYVEICKQYGYGWIVYPGSTFCMKFQGQWEIDGPTMTKPKDLLFLVQDGKTGSYAQTFINKSQQDSYGFTTSIKPGVEIRTQTAYGRASATYVVQMTLTNGNQATVGSIWAGGEPAAKPACFTCSASYSWGPLGSISVGRFSSEFQYFATGDALRTANGFKNRPLHMLYQWNSSGTNQDPVGWTLNFSMEDPFNNNAMAKGQYGTVLAGLSGNPCAVTAVSIAAGTGCNGFGSIATTIGPIKWWDMVPNVRWLDDEIGSAFASFVWHEIDVQARGPTAGAGALAPFAVSGGVACPGFAPPILTGGACTTVGQAQTTHGWASLWSLVLNLPKTPGHAPFARDFIFNEVVFGKGAMGYLGINGGQGSLFSNDIAGENVGGLLLDHHDGIQIANGGGGFFTELEKGWSYSMEYRHYLTTCTDPDWCWRMNLHYNIAQAIPGPITQNTDWTKGGLGKGTSQKPGVVLCWGVPQLTMQICGEAMYMKVKQDLAHDPGLAPTPLPFGLKKDNDNWAFSINVARNFGGSVGKNLAGF